MGSKKRFILKSLVTVCLLAVLSTEGLFLYCHYIKHVSTIQYASDRLRDLQEWVFHNGTQTANAQTPNAQTPVRREIPDLSAAAPGPLLYQTAVYAIQETFGDDALVIPEDDHISVSSDTLSADTLKTGDDPTEMAAKTETKADLVTVSSGETASLPAPVTLQELIARQESDGLSPNEDSRIQLDAEAILQYPELPTGCEVTSLTMALRFAGYDVSKEELADTYLEKASPGSVSYKSAFWGDPRQSGSFGCYAPVIVNAANRYLEEQESPKRAYDLTGTPFDDILAEIRMGCPVIVWGSMYINEEIVFSYGWEIDGETVTWPSNEHCMLLIGFDMENNSVIVCDPLEGIASYDKTAFQHHYETLEQQAIVIY